MKMKDFLESNRNSILDSWFKMAIGIYPEESRKYFVRKNNQFGNPVGANTHKYMSQVLDGVISRKQDSIEKPLLDLMHIRAVQEIKPSVSTRLFQDLKGIIADSYSGFSEKYPAEIESINHQLDNLTLSAFDSYLYCREKIYEIKANEIKNRTFRMIDRLSRKYDKMSIEGSGEDEN